MNQYDSVPSELKALRQWVCFDIIERDGKKTKIPLNPRTGGNAQSNNSRTWGTFDEAVKGAVVRGNAGIGIMFANGVVGVDLDHCIDENGALSDTAADVLKALDTYCEYSPSGTGLHFLAYGDLADGARKYGNIEMYSEGRFFTVTGRPFGAVKPIKEQTEQLAAIHNKLLVEAKETARKAKQKDDGVRDTPSSGKEEDIVEIAGRSKTGKAFMDLYRGNWQELGYPSQSEADMAFCNMLAFWTARDAQKMDEIVRRSGLMRAKWDRRQSGTTYGALVVEKAIRDCREVFDPSRNHYEVQFKITTPKEEKQQEKKPRYTYDDTGNAYRLADMFRGKIHYSYVNKCWYYWDGACWQMDVVGQLNRYMDEMIKEMNVEAFNMEEDAQKAFLRWVGKTRFNKTKAACLKEAEHMDGIPITPGEMDRGTHLLNCLNGIVNLRTGELLPHDPSYNMTKICYANYVQKPTPIWDGFLETVTGGDAELIEFIQKAVGYSLTGSNREQCMFACYGSGQNGKSTFLETVRQLAGTYALNTQPETVLTRGKEGNINPDIARLKSARLVTTTETAEGARLNEALIKQLTGGDRVTARFLYGKEFEFDPEFKIWMATNHKPIITGTDDGIWRRMRLIPFTVQIPAEKIDRNLKNKLRVKELDGILYWAVQGCLKWQRDGLASPSCVAEATKEYRQEMDILGQFLGECTEVQTFAEVPASTLYQCYKAWATMNGLFVMSSTRFGREISVKFEKTHTRNGWFYKSLSLNEYGNKLLPFEFKIKNQQLGVSV